MLSEILNAFRKPFTGGLGYEQITVADTAIGLTVPTGAQRAVLIVEAQPLRYRDDGEDPTTSAGMPVAAAVRFEIESRESLLAFKAIRSTGSSSTLNVTYYK